MKATKLARYGSESYTNLEKAKKTCLERYGVDNPSKSVEVMNKIKAANQEKFGVDWSFQSEEVKNKITATILDRFGVENVSQSDKIKKKKIVTFQEKLGVSNPFQSDEIKKKIKKHYEDKHGNGITHPSMVKSVKDKKDKIKRDSFWRKIQTDHRLNETAIPLFSKEEYKDTDRTNVYKFQCLKCNGIFEDHIDGGHLPRCLGCFPLDAGFSGSEKEMVEFIKSIVQEEVIENSRRILPSGLEIDAYIPSKKLAFEFDGTYWHSELAGKSKDYHLNKTNECESLGIHLVHIFEDEWKDKNEIIKAKIRSLLIRDRPVGGRELAVKTIDLKSKNEFLEKHHIQGKDHSSHSYGAFFKDELIAVCTFVKPRVALGRKTAKQGEFELSRFATSRSIVGILPKFLKHFVDHETVNKIYSFADRRFTSSISNIYQKCGFKLVSITPKNYWYFQHGSHKRWHRFGFRKDKLPKRLQHFDVNKTEWENMIGNGWNRIWDCGSLKYTFIVPKS
jgi:hypothetical protein